MFSVKITRLLGGVLLFALLLAACAPSQTNNSAPTASNAIPAATAAAGNGSAGETPIKVVTTMSVLADMIKNVGGQRVQVENIIPLGAGPEDYQPAPQDAQKIAEASIVFYNGFGLEEWLDPLFASAGKPDQPRIELTEGLTPLVVGGEEYSQGNPHFWMSAAHGVTYVENIRKGLAALDPAGEATYTANAKAYSQQLQALNEELKEQAQQIPEAQRKLVTNHDAFPYFAQEYGFAIVGSILGNPQAEPSAGDVAKLIADIRLQNVKAIFSESQFSQKLTDTISNDAGVQIVANLATDTLGDSASGVTTYIDMLRYDMRTITDALK